MLAMTEVKSVSACVSIPHPSSFICGYPGAGQVSPQRGLSPQTLTSAGITKH